MTFFAAVIGIDFSNFGQVFCTLKILTLTCIQGQGRHIDFDPNFR